MEDINIYKKIFEMSPEAIVLLDTKGNVIEVNGRLYDWLGYKPEEVINKNIISLPYLPVHSKAEAIKNLGLRVLGKEVKPYQLDFIDKNNKNRTGLITATLIKDSLGKIIYDLILISDITNDENCKLKIKKDLDQQELISLVAIKLNSEKDFDLALNEAVEIIGKHINVSRVYIFEDSKDSNYTSNTHEWNNIGVKSQKENLQNIDYKIIPSWKELVYGNGVLVNENTEKLPSDLKKILSQKEIKSILVFPLRKDEKPFGFIGFDETRKARNWTMFEIELLRTLSNIIASAYAKEEYEKALKEKIDELEKMNRLMVGRELKMAELKNQIKDGANQ
ncbi:hypothetical protein A3E89_01200 [Candidatus Campbellbacteria bacterium RIFCSPHIGHO2_12_FULL_35_10]|uniref:PAS domain-containing protein n=1 Tax=Candidatus Campbellbacteria bacterium RIFCSPHIGHO2_12_FULL_35_10 TaxID=1797578 RepID=A0A1F5ENP8_9BACT|nr:MAG: hypothetical protein A3E89_01200 [Candidatus Campbellbacteria bacterium RIFCSPHIGHO2_12_FULL_35_10]